MRAQKLRVRSLPGRASLDAGRAVSGARTPLPKPAAAGAATAPHHWMSGSPVAVVTSSTSGL